jgi:hypothetical protein
MVRERDAIKKGWIIMTRAYKVSEIGGTPIVNECLGREDPSIHIVQFGDKRVKIIGSAKGRDFTISADLEDVEVFFNLDAPNRISPNRDIYPNELFFNIRFSIPFYTIQTTENPVEITIDEIEKKLGYKVSIVNKEGDS